MNIIKQGTELQKAGYFLMEVKGLSDDDFMDSGMIEAIAKLIVGYNEFVTTPTQPQLSGGYTPTIDETSATPPSDSGKPTQPKLSAIDVFKKHGAHYYEDDEQDIINAMEEYRNQPSTPFKPERSPKEEAEMVKKGFNDLDYEHYSINDVAEFAINVTIQALQKRGLDTNFEEQMLNELRGV